MREGGREEGREGKKEGKEGGRRRGYLLQSYRLTALASKLIHGCLIGMTWQLRIAQISPQSEE